MSGELILVIVIIAFAAIYFVVPFAIGTYLKYRGKMVVTCPETRKIVGVEVDVKHAALTASVGHPDLRLRSCTRWPERSDCGQECLLQIELSPEDCQVRRMLTDWYKEKNCTFCGKPFGEIHWFDHKPALEGPDKKFIEWSQFKVEEINQVLGTHKPVCWNCAVTEEFMQEHPDVVFERPQKHIAGAAKK